MTSREYYKKKFGVEPKEDVRFLFSLKEILDLQDEFLNAQTLSFSDWLKEVTEIDVKQKFLLEYTELIEWQEWYQKGLTPNEAVKLNYHNYG